MKELRTEMIRSKEYYQRTLQADINRLTALVMQLAARSLKQKAEELPRVRFQQDEEDSE